MNELFADVILPLPLHDTYTYRIPAEWEGSVLPGKRVLVSFGRTKIYSALVIAVHSVAPKGMEIKEIVRAAQWTPSYKNCQPWQVVAVSGSRKEELTSLLLGLLEQNAPPTPDLPTPREWPEPQHSLITDLMAKRSALAGIDLNAPEFVIRSKKANFRFYGAPCGLFLTHNASLGPWSILDAGMFAQSLMLAAHARGLATVPQAFLTDYAAQVKEFLGLSSDTRLLLGMSLGYPADAPEAMPPRPERVPLEAVLRFIS